VVAARLSIALVGLLFAAPTAHANVTFEPVPLGTTPDVQEIVLVNDGDDPFETGVPTITGADASTFSFVYDYCINDTLDPGEDCEMAVEFDPLRTGPNGATLEVPIVGEPEPFRVGLSGEGKPSLSVTPGAYDFGTLPALGAPTSAGQPTVDVTIQNVTSDELSGLRAHVTGTPPFFTRFSSSPGTCAATLAPGATCAFKVTFTGWRAGSYTGDLRVMSGTKTLATVPLSATLKGSPHGIPIAKPPKPKPTPSAVMALSARLSAAVKGWKHADRARLRRGFVLSGFVAPSDGKLELTIVGGHAVARGSLELRAGKPARLHARLTSAGRRLLRLDRKLRLRAVVRFVPSADGRVLRVAAELPLRANDKH
jgi:hypothetical protein